MTKNLLERSAVLRSLHTAVTEAAAGRGRVVVLTGEAGIGKTSVLRHFRSTLPPGVRLLSGACDDLVTPRPLGPLRDAVLGLPGVLSAALARGQRDEVFDAVLAELGGLPPSVLVVEDLHWADDATLDVVTFLARRVELLPAALVLTSRENLRPDHPLHAVLGGLTGDRVDRMRLRPLSSEAVATLAAGTSWDPAALYELTGGNPFFVTEALAGSPGDDVPETVAQAVLARVRGLSPAGRHALESLCVVPGGVDFPLAEALLGRDLSDLDEAEQLGMVGVGADGVSFRHELARRSLLASLSRLRRRLLHARVVTALLAQPEPDLSRVVHHALRAANAEVVARYAPAAGRESASAGSHRQALAHYAAALRYADWLPLPERAHVLDEHAWELYNAHRFDEAILDSERAVALFAAIGDQVAEGEALVRLSRHHYMSGDTDSALAAARRGVAVLEHRAGPASTAYAMTNHGSLLALGDDPVHATAVLDRAHALAAAAHRPDLMGLCLNYQSIARPALSDDERIGLVTESLRLAVEQGDHEYTARGYANRAELLYRYGRFAELSRCVDEGLAFATERGFRSHAYNLEVHRCLLWMRRGQWAPAERGLLALVGQLDDPGMLEVYSVPSLARLQARRGADLAAVGATLDRVWRRARRQRLLLGLAFAGTALVEWAWLAGRPERIGEVLHEWSAHANRPGAGPVTAELLRYAARAGHPVATGATPDALPEPWLAGLRGDWQAAAAGWAAVGDPYERALELAGSGDVDATLDGLRVLEELGAAATVRLVKLRLRDLGVRAIPRGPTRSTRTNPAGLTDRQLDVLERIAQDRTNSEIAAELVLSVRTVDHHVSMMLAKLGVTSRREAAELVAGWPFAASRP